MKMRTRIKKLRVVGKDRYVYVVQTLENDGQFRTIEGGYAKTEEEAKGIRKRYKAVGKFVQQFNQKYNGNAILHFPKFQHCNYQKKDEEGGN